MDLSQQQDKLVQLIEVPKKYQSFHLLVKQPNLSTYSTNQKD